jgi:hypothetical protein
MIIGGTGEESTAWPLWGLSRFSEWETPCSDFQTTRVGGMMKEARGLFFVLSESAGGVAPAWMEIMARSAMWMKMDFKE